MAREVIMRIAMAAALAAIVAGAATWLTIEVKANRLVWDHFDVVTPGVFYRSGQLNPEQLAEAIETYRLKTVVSFLLPGPEVEAERRLVERLGAEFLHLPMPGDGFGREEQFRQVLDAIDDPTRRPVLAHCARGTCRTGSIVALYRMERQGWTLDDVAHELERQGYRDGWICGYVYGMVDSWPTDAFPGIPPRDGDSPEAAGEGDREAAPELAPLPEIARADRTSEHGGSSR
jgi:protein tyrosine phosphatase (PTP) superfamily phosphohydrolase (DUF442 family)